MIDADLRKPTLHKQLGLAPEEGFCDYLRDPGSGQAPKSLYTHDPLSGLSMVLGARHSETPTDQLLNSSTFDALVQQARDHFDTIILDTPPLIPVVDARYIAHHADAVLMMVRHSVVHQRDIRAAAVQIQEAMRGDAAFFAVLNREPNSRRQYEHYGYYADAEAQKEH